MKKKVLIIFKYPRGNWNPPVIKKFSNYYDTEFLYISNFKNRNFTEIIDNINNLIKSKNKNRCSGPYNFGPKIKKNYTVLKLTQEFLDKLINKKYKIEFNKSNLFEADFLDINSSKSRTKLEWETKYSGSKMIEKTIDWYKVFINEPSKIEQFSKKQILDYFSYKIN